MSQIRPKVLARSGRQNEPVRVPIQDLLIDVTKTSITVDSASGSGSLTVKNIYGFAVNQILLIGEPGSGNEGSEIIKTHAATAPTGSTITLASNTLFPHSSSTSVYIIGFDQVEISTSATVGGTKTVLATVTLAADQEATLYNDIVTTTGFYYARFKNTITNTFSAYSDPMPVGGYTPTTARRIIDNALNQINKNTSEILTDEFAFQQINNCQMETLREFKRWSFMQKFDAIIGNATTGDWRVALPTDCDDQNTTKSIYNFRIGKEMDLIWIDKETFNELMEGIAYSTLAAPIGLGDVTITLTDSSDFDAVGSINVAGNDYAYTANDTSTGVLTIAASTTTNTLGQYAFQAAEVGTPQYFTIYGGFAYFYPILSSQYTGRNYVMDYYKALVEITHDSDQIILPDPTVVEYYLCWKFLLKLNNGEASNASTAMYQQYVIRREKTKQKESLNREFILI